MHIQYTPVDPEPILFSNSPYLHVGIGGTCISLLGSGMHFIYKWSDCSALAAVFCAVNESVYEHIKIMLFPMLLWWIGVAILTSRRSDALNAATGAMYLGTCILLVFNAASQALEFESLAFDISLFVVCIYAGQAMGAAIMLRRWSFYYQIFLLALVVVLFTCTFAPPQWPYLFEDHRNRTFGRPSGCI